MGHFPTSHASRTQLTTASRAHHRQSQRNGAILIYQSGPAPNRCNSGSLSTLRTIQSANLGIPMLFAGGPKSFVSGNLRYTDIGRGYPVQGTEHPLKAVVLISLRCGTSGIFRRRQAPPGSFVDLVRLSREQTQTFGLPRRAPNPSATGRSMGYLLLSMFCHPTTQ